MRNSSSFLHFGAHMLELELEPEATDSDFCCCCCLFHIQKISIAKCARLRLRPPTYAYTGGREGAAHTLKVQQPDDSTLASSVSFRAQSSHYLRQRASDGDSQSASTILRIRSLLLSPSLPLTLSLSLFICFPFSLSFSAFRFHLLSAKVAKCNFWHFLLLPKWP